MNNFRHHLGRLNRHKESANNKGDTKKNLTQLFSAFMTMKTF